MEYGQNFTIERSEDTLYTVRCGERYQDYLGVDECLYLITRLLVAGDSPQKALPTKEEHEARNRSLGFNPGLPLDDWQRQLPEAK